MQRTIRASRFFPSTQRHAPNDAVTPGHKLLLRAGFIRQVGSGVFILAPLAMRVLAKIEAIIREEMNRIGGLEVSLPILQPADLWKQSGRWDRYVRDGIMFRSVDRHNQEYGVAPTAEEMATFFAAMDLQSYAQLPLMLWQMDWKFRDEIRPRMGLIRSRAFRMKDSYSFDENEEGMRRSYGLHRKAYQRIFERMEVDFVSVQADSGAIGGKGSSEFMALSEYGEDILLTCSTCDYGANREKAESIVSSHNDDAIERPLRKEPTPGLTTIQQLCNHFGVSERDIMKTVIYVSDGVPLAVCCRGDLEINEIKLANLVRSEKLELADESLVRSTTGVRVGFAGPIGLKRSVRVIFDVSTKAAKNVICGCNEEDMHLFDVNFGRDIPTPDQFYDVHVAKAGDGCPSCSSGILRESKGVEIGHVFMLQQGYAQKFNASYLGPDGKSHIPWVGCYGMGTTRCLQAIVEQKHDKDGIQWPEAIAPFRYVIIPTAMAEGAAQRSMAEKLFTDMGAIDGVEVVFDDRPLGFGAKMKDALLIGYPYILVAGKGSEKGEIEVQQRVTGEQSVMSAAAFVKTLTAPSVSEIV